MLENLGDYYRIHGIAEQPVIENEHFATYYWFEVFRRATILQSPFHTSCWHIILDVYIKDLGEQCIEVDTLASSTVSRLQRCVNGLMYTLCPAIGAHRCWLEVNDMHAVREGISFHVLLCGFAEQPHYELVERIYIEVARVTEKRDPLSTPLWVDVKEIMMYKLT